MSNNTESSLTSPEDRKKGVFKLHPTVPVLNETDSKNAIEDLNQNTLLKSYPRIERKFVDPHIMSQQIGLISFVPAKGATPNDRGIYGFAKLRGNYQSDIEANERAEFLIRNVDSYNKIYHTYVGRPFPLTTSSEFSNEIEQIDLKKQIKESVSQDIKQKRMDERKQIEEIKERERKLKEDVSGDEDPYDLYTTLRVKLAQIGFSYLEMDKKKQEMKDIILKTRTQLEEMDDKNPDFKEQYMERYMSARRDAGIKDDDSNNFISFMGSDLKEELGF